jgi:hypothetical protein
VEYPSLSSLTVWVRASPASRNEELSDVRLRHAKDKEEFDQFMAQHRPRPAPPRDGQPQP